MFVNAIGVFFVARVATTCTSCNSTLFSVSSSVAFTVIAALMATIRNNLFIFLFTLFINNTK